MNHVHNDVLQQRHLSSFLEKVSRCILMDSLMKTFSEVLHFCWLQRAYPVGKYLIKFSKNEETYGIKDSIKGIEDSINLDGCSASVVAVNFGKYWLIWFFCWVCFFVMQCWKVVKHTLNILLCEHWKILKYVWSFFNITHKRVNHEPTNLGL